MSVRNILLWKGQHVERTRIITTLRANPFPSSLRPSGLTESPLFRIGLALRLFAVELAAEVLE